MFRPNPEHTLFGQIPVRLIISIILIFAVVISIILVLGIEREKMIVERMVNTQELPQEKVTTFFKSREDLITLSIVLFLLSGIGVSVVVTYQSYHATRKTLEQVKSLARNILHSVPSGILTVDQEGRITALNPFAEHILNLSAASTLGQPISKVLPEGDPMRSLLEKALMNRNYVQDLDLSYPSLGNKMTTVRVTTSALQDLAQQSAGVVMLLQDVGDLVLLEQRLRTSEKLSALDTLSAGVAHEIRNPLSALDLNLHLLEGELSQEKKSEPRVEKYLEILNVEVQRLKEILDNFLRFSKPTPLKITEVSIGQILMRLLHLLSYEADEKHIKIETQLTTDLPPVMGDETQLSQVFLNILINAFQAMPQGGLIRMTSAVTGEVPHQTVELHFQDTGVGIPQKELSKLFEPFYSTKKEGSGLGLAIAYRIVEDHHGTIRVDSQEGKGTTVTVRLPVASIAKKVEQVPT